MARSRFNPGSGRSTFTCTMCGKRTREVSENIGLDLCELCAVKCGQENTMLDNIGRDVDEWLAKLDACKTADECYEVTREAFKAAGMEGQV